MINSLLSAKQMPTQKYAYIEITNLNKNLIKTSVADILISLRTYCKSYNKVIQDLYLSTAKRSQSELELF